VTFTIMVTGSRGWANKRLLWGTLDNLCMEVERAHPEPVEFVLLCGGAKGADEMAAAWADNRGYSVRVMPAQWKLHGKRAGILRNEQMVNTHPDIVVAFWDGSSPGTAHAKAFAEAAGIETRVVTS
jgi:hypothetical protein